MRRTQRSASVIPFLPSIPLNLGLASGKQRIWEKIASDLDYIGGEVLPTTLIRLEKYTGRIGAVALCRNTKALGA